MDDTDVEQFAEYTGWGPETTGFYKNKRRQRIEFWVSGPYGVTMVGWIPLSSDGEQLRYWMQAVGKRG